MSSLLCLMSRDNATHGHTNLRLHRTLGNVRQESVSRCLMVRQDGTVDGVWSLVPLYSPTLGGIHMDIVRSIV